MFLNAFKRFLALALAVVMVFSMLPMEASAAEVTVLDEKIKVSDTLGLLSSDGNNVTATASATSETDVCNNVTWSASSNTITVTNTSGSKAIIKFSYGVSGATAFTINGVSKMDELNGSYSATLENNGTVEFAITSGNQEGNTATLNLSGFEVAADETRDLTFLKVTEGGTATAGGVELSTLTTDSYTVAATYETGVAVTATPASGFSFLAWLDSNNNIVSTTPNTTLKPTANMTVYPVFVAKSSTQGWWQTSGKLFSDLNAATTTAVSGDKTVVLMRDATLPAGDYSVPAGVTMLIPFDAGNTLYTTTPGYVSGTNAYTSPSAYRTLTMASGANLVINGALSVSAKHATIRGGQPNGSAPTDKYGHIKMNSGSTMNVTGALYAWGYISGDGVITAENGAVVYENMQFTDFRGGSITSGMTSNTFFPMSQYYVQNIETKLILKPGASEYAVATIEASGTIASTPVKFIAPSGSMFATGANTTVTKDYHPATDRLEITVDGDFSINSMELSVSAPIVGQVEINSGTFVLPINSNIDIILTSGTTTLNQDLALLPGVTLTVGANATLNVASDMELHAYDRDDYVGKAYVHNSNDLICAPYSPDPSRVTRTSADLLDAKIDVNGTISLSGAMYTTAGGAKIISSEETGKIVFEAGAGTLTVTQQNDVEGNEVDVAITSAKLLNGDGTTYVETAGTTAGNGFVYDAEADKWIAAADAVITYEPNGASGDAVTATITKADILAGNNTHTVADNTFTNDKAEFTGWNTAADGSGTAYAPGAALTTVKNVTLYAQWKSNAYTITFNANGADNTMEAQTVEASGTSAALNANTLTREGYRFAGWATAADGEVIYDDGATIDISGDVELYAVWVQQAVITFHDGENTATQTVDAGVATELDANSFTAPEGYSFAGWATEQGGEVVYADGAEITVSAATNLYAVWTANTYTLTWVIDGAKSTETLVYGASITAPADPEKEGHTFTGWTGDTIPATMPAKALTITLTSTWMVNQYTITFVTDGGTAIDPITQDYGTAITAPADPEKEGHTFAGWDKTIPATMPAQNLTITANWTVNNYKLVFTVDGETVYDAAIPYGTAITAPADPEKEGHTFAGWSPAVPATMPASDLTITATWTVNSYTITFDTQGGTGIASITQEYGSQIEKPEDPTKEGHTFAGWNKEIPTTMPAEDLTITASWTVNNYTLTYVVDGVEKTVDVPYGANPADYLPTDLTKTGYTFGGWQGIVEKMPASGLTVTAIWNVDQFTLTFVNGETTVSQETLDYEAPITAPADPVKEGYTFIGWDVDGDGNKDEVAATMPAQNLTYTAVFKVNQYTIEFQDDKGNVLYDMVLDYGTTIIVLTPSKDGYTFVGWNEEIPATMPAYDVVITSTWTANEYTITFITDDAENPYHVITANTDESITDQMPADPTKDHYTFAGWSEEIPATMPAGGMTVSATWTPNQYLVTFLNGEQTMQATNVTYDTIPVYSGETPTKEADAQYTYTFAGWDVDGDGIADEIGKVTGETTYYAVFEGTLNTYTITWLDWDGTVLETDENVLWGTTPCYDGELPTREKTAEYTYTFNGWTPGFVSVDGDATYTADYLAEANVYTIWFMIDGEEYAVDTLAYGSAITAPEVAEREGYTFSGWTIPETMPAEDITLDATWTVNSYTLTFKVDGEVIQETEVEYGAAVTAPEYTPAEGYDFSGWGEVPVTMPAEDVTIEATTTIKTFTVTWVDYDGTVLEIDENVPYGSDPEFNGATPTRAADNYNTYTFAKWGPNDVTTIKEDVTFMAAYTATPIVYIVTFLDGETVLTDLQQNVGYGDEITLPVLENTAEQVFLGWQDADGIYEGGSSWIVTGSQTFTAVWEAETYTLTVSVLVTGDLVELTVPCGANVLEVLEQAAAEDKIPAIGSVIRINNENENGERTVAGYSYWDETNGEWNFDLEGLTMPASDFSVDQDYDFMGWAFCYDEDNNYLGAEYCGESDWLNSGWHYIEEDFDDVEGGAWYYFYESPEMDNFYFRAEGITRVPYPTEAIKGNTYAPNTEDLQYAEDNNIEFIDKETGLFWFDTDGKLLYDYTGVVPGEEVSRWATNGLITWHPGLVESEGEYYYFIGDEVNGGNIMATGDVYIARNSSELTVTISGVYTFADDGKLCKYDGITKMADGTLRYYENYQLMAGKGLIKVGEDYYYVRSNGELVVGTSYWVADVNEYTDIATGMYEFDADGKLIIPVPDPVKDGIYYENGAWYYYENGVIGYNKGLIETDKSWYNSGDVILSGHFTIYVRSGGQLATGEYYVTNVANYTGSDVKSGDCIEFNEYGVMQTILNGIVDVDGVLYYYQNNKIAYGAGLIQIDGSYYYVRSGGQLAVNCDYWVSNVNDTGVEPGCYTFGADGVMVYRDGIVEENGGLFYYVDGKLACCAGVVEIEDGVYIYVRSNGQLATGSYWPTNTNGLLEQGMYDFGTDGRYVAG